MIAIPNMKLPPWCGKCILQDGEICYAINENDIGSGLSFFDLEDLRNFCIKRRDTCPLIEIVKCKECKHRPIKDDPDGADYGFNIVEPTDGDDVCPCIVEDGWYSWMPEDGFYCGRGERRSE